MYNQFMNMMEITAQMRENKKIEFKDQLKIVILLSVPAILEQLVGTAMSYIDTAMVGSLGYKASCQYYMVIWWYLYSSSIRFFSASSPIFRSG